MSILSEFKEFALRGNVIDLAVGVVIGGAFGKIVTSLVNDLIMPSVSVLISSADFKSLSAVLRPATIGADGKETMPAILLNYGAFVQTIVDFTIIAVVIFLAIKVINRIRRQEQPETPAASEPSEEVKLLTEIRDALKKQGT
ncbi:MAG: large-conductance mechanosensitive channel protein MscL [Arenimonas sp.]|jgi:large conductance mechanosensitive channel|uniref:large-conductance mechanosensitive channel protein MscL n=1 Tax=Arenimonas sp. TaxID=1872635 RepID=UPI001B42D6E0|nr:large-conductance mechanosensitive channel protein MscL [Arenimonas sp.]